VGRNLIPPLAQVDLHHTLSVDREALVRIHHNTEQARVGVDQLGLESHLQVVEHRGVVQEGQVGHVFAFLKLGRVHLANLGGLEHFFLMTTHDGSLGAIVTVEKTLSVASFWGWHPHRLLGIVRLQGILTFHFHRHHQIRQWVWIWLTRFSELDMTRHVA